MSDETGTSIALTSLVTGSIFPADFGVGGEAVLCLPSSMYCRPRPCIQKRHFSDGAAGRITESWN